MKKKVLPLILVLALVLSGFSMAFADTPADVAGTGYADAVDALTELGIVSGYPDGSYKPENPVTRAEMAKLIITALEMDDEAIALYAGDFSDVTSHWAKGYIGYAAHLGIIKGYPDKTFKPGNTVNYNEAVTMLVRALGYADDSLTGSWPENYADKGEELGILKGIDGTTNAATRGDIAKMLYQTLDEEIGGTADKAWTAREGDTMRARLTTDEETPAAGKIPYGSRLIHEYEFSGAFADHGENIANSPYYEIPDFYKLTSGDTLTMLTNFSTTQQMTDWSCGLSSILMTLEWYGMRGDINEMDLAHLRGRELGGATTVKEMLNVFDGLSKKLGQKWQIKSTYDLTYDEDEAAMLEVADGNALYLEEAIPYYLERGIPVIVGWNDWGGHYQVIIGYDDMGTETTQDDVLILADPYDTTDHMQDGYIVQSYERLIYDWSVGWDPEFDALAFVVAVPDGYAYKGPVKGAGAGEDKKNAGVFTDNHVLSYPQKMKDSLAEMAKTYAHPIEIGKNGLAGPADAAYYRAGDHNYSPYYKFVDAYNLNDSKTRIILPRYKTIQQATEYTCGVTSMLTVLEYYGMRGDLNEVDLANFRDKKDDLPGTTIAEMKNVIKHLETDLGQKWDVVTSEDLVEGDSEFGCGIMDGKTYVDLGELFIHYLKKGTPIMVMWHEWAGHYQVVIGYDDMGTEGTQDDVLILVDPYDTTDHNQDGYLIESYERLAYDWGNTYDEDNEWGAFVVMSPAK